MKVLEVFHSKDAADEGHALTKHIQDRYTAIATPLAKVNPQAEMNLPANDRKTTPDIDRISLSSDETKAPSDIISSDGEESEDPPVVDKRKNKHVSVARTPFNWRSPVDSLLKLF